MLSVTGVPEFPGHIVVRASSLQSQPCKCSLLLMARKFGHAHRHRLLLGGRLRLVHQLQPSAGPIDRPIRKQGRQRVAAMLPGETASPSPLLGPLHQVRPQRVPLDVSQCDQKMPIVLDGKALEPTLVEMPMSHRVVGVFPSLSVGQRRNF